MLSWLHELQGREPELEMFVSARPELISSAANEVGPLPTELASLLQVSNGLACRSFRLFSVFDPDNPRKTWESLQRANSEESEFFQNSAELRGRFLVFAQIGTTPLMWDREDESIWYYDEEDEALQQTDMTFREAVSQSAENAQ